MITISILCQIKSRGKKQTPTSRLVLQIPTRKITSNSWNIFSTLIYLWVFIDLFLLKHMKCVIVFFSLINCSYIIHIINICIAIKDQRLPHGNLLLVGKNYNILASSLKIISEHMNTTSRKGEVNCRALDFDMLQWDFMMQVKRAQHVPQHLSSILNLHFNTKLVNSWMRPSCALECTWRRMNQTLV